jgi:hypothetical protein
MAAKLNDLVPDFRDKVSTLLTNCAAKGITMVPSEGLRTPAQQAIYWRQSRSLIEINNAIANLRNSGAPYLADVLESVGPRHGDEVTKVLPGNSWHQWGEAVDCFWEVDGKAEWSTSRKVNGLNGYQVYAQEAKNLGLTAGFFWPRFKDTPHVQLRGDDNPRSAGFSWPDIDQRMHEQFGAAAAPSMATALTPEIATAAPDQIRLSYAAPEGWRVFETTDHVAAVFRSKMSICADGAPRAYNKDDGVALDYLANAGRPGNWWALVTDSNGNPVVQGQNDPAPGYYVSMTALTNPGASSTTPAHYIDASTIPYVVLPAHRFTSFTSIKRLHLGDVGVAYNVDNNEMAFAQFCETGPDGALGEASIALANALGVNSNPKHGGVSGRRIVYVVFPGTGLGRGFTVAQINATATPVFESWGGLARLKSYAQL